MDFNSYFEKIKKNDGFTSTGITKEYYLDIIETCIDAYKKEDLEAKLPKEEEGSLDDICAFSRITSAIAILLANGRKQDYRDLWERMMDACCKDALTAGRPDFSVKEIMLAYKVMKGKVTDEKRQIWLNYLSRLDPYINYKYVLKEENSSKSVHNINIYNMVGEFLRETEGITDTKEYFDRHWPKQMEHFDENGMYMDPGNPMLYDLTTRCQIQIMLGYGYRGTYYEELDERLKKAALNTLFMQSSSFEHPYGGRSNQYLFNEALIAANYEYEAVRYKNMGDLKTAGMFKRSAHLASVAIKRWLLKTPPMHIKNFYPVESLYGTEGYGYYDKYMVTLGCFIYIAYLFADDTIEEYPCPAEMGGYVFKTSTAFHKIFANCKGNFIEIDTKADFHYDATGLGRFHKAGLPSELAISLPFSATPNYNLPERLLKRNISICPGWEYDEGKVQYLAELSEGLEHEYESIEVSSERVVFSVKYSGEIIKGCEGVKETYTVDSSGVSIEVELINPMVNKIYYIVPLFVTNGMDESTITGAKGSVHVKVKDFNYRVNSTGILTIGEKKYMETEMENTSLQVFQMRVIKLEFL